jgi:serine/threonine-protein kinase HipA
MNTLTVQDASSDTTLGELERCDSTVSFSYHPTWLREARAFALDPQLTLGAHRCPDRLEQGPRSALFDHLPETWGLKLLREAGHFAPLPHLLTWLAQSSDHTRLGALRFAEATGARTAAQEAPPERDLPMLAHAAQVLTDSASSSSAREEAAARLAHCGVGLGGMRAKASFTAADGALWLAKFAQATDPYDVGGWEMVAHRLAVRAGLDVPPARYGATETGHHFCVQRFDRTIAGERRFYVSAAALLTPYQARDAHYLELVELLSLRGESRRIARELCELFCRIAFFVMMGNRDDHLRNHGFFLSATGLILAPAFDVNPQPEMLEHSLGLSEEEPLLTIAALWAHCGLFRLTPEEAAGHIEAMAQAIDPWREVAAELHLTDQERAWMERAFSAHTQYRQGYGRRRLQEPGARPSRRF